MPLLLSSVHKYSLLAPANTPKVRCRRANVVPPGSVCQEGVSELTPMISNITPFYGDTSSLLPIARARETCMARVTFASLPSINESPYYCKPGALSFDMKGSQPLVVIRVPPISTAHQNQEVSYSVAQTSHEWQRKDAKLTYVYTACKHVFPVAASGSTVCCGRD
jgi:hypothetical protein